MLVTATIKAILPKQEQVYGSGTENSHEVNYRKEEIYDSETVLDEA